MKAEKSERPKVRYRKRKNMQRERTREEKKVSLSIYTINVPLFCKKNSCIFTKQKKIPHSDSAYKTILMPMRVNAVANE